MRIFELIQDRKNNIPAGPPGLILPPKPKSIEQWAKEVREYNQEMKQKEKEYINKFKNGEL